MKRQITKFRLYLFLAGCLLGPGLTARAESGTEEFVALKREIQQIPSAMTHRDNLQELRNLSRRTLLCGDGGLEYRSSRVLYVSLQLMFAEKCSRLHCPDYDPNATYSRNPYPQPFRGEEPIPEFLARNEEIGKCMDHEEMIRGMIVRHIRFAGTFGIQLLSAEDIKTYIIPLIWVNLNDEALIEQAQARFEEAIKERNAPQNTSSPEEPAGE